MVQFPVKADTKTPDHRGGHRRLLWQADEATPHAKGARPLTWYTRNATYLQRRRTAPAMRPVQARELEFKIPSPSPALAPRVFTAKWARPLLSRLGVVSSHSPHALVATDVALAGQEGQAEGDDYGDKRPSQQLHA